MGDPAGIGPEILVKTLSEQAHSGLYQPLVIGTRECMRAAADASAINLKFNSVAGPGEMSDGVSAIPVVEPGAVDLKEIVLGNISAEAGRAAVSYVEESIRLAMNGEVAAMVTCPINKEAIHLAGFKGDIGHQEIIARMTGAKLTATMLMTQGLKVAHLSTHKSLAEAVRYVRAPIICEKLMLTHQCLKAWGIAKPRIAVAALNPHGGEGGLLGREEIDEILPAVELSQRQGISAHGPYPADSVFYRAIDGEFDAVLALYHDQGHIAIKVHNFEDSITATMGIPFIRTSVDHGTAFEIAGQNKANPNSLKQAISAAISMIQGRL